MSNGPIRPRHCDVVQDFNVGRISLAVHDGLHRGIVSGPYNMLHDYTQEDMDKVYEAGRKLGLERECSLMKAVLGEHMNTSVANNPIPPKQDEKNHYNRKARRRMEAEKRKKRKAVKKLIANAKSLIK